MPAWVPPPKSFTRAVGRAVHDYNMIRDGDRLLVGVSGGKDSLSLLHTLGHLRRYAPVSFELAAVTVDPQIEGFDPSPLRTYVADLGVPHFYRSEPIMQRALTHMHGDSFCSFCSRMRRGILYTTARANGYNVLVLAQHLDDLAESFLMSAFHRGRLETMKAHYRVDAGDLRVIRPFVYLRERQTAQFANDVSLPVIPDNCPACFSTPTQRQHMKSMLAREERAHSKLFPNLLHAMRPLMGEPPAPATCDHRPPLHAAG